MTDLAPRSPEEEAREALAKATERVRSTWHRFWNESGNPVRRAQLTDEFDGWLSAVSSGVSLQPEATPGKNADLIARPVPSRDLTELIALFRKWGMPEAADALAAHDAAPTTLDDSDIRAYCRAVLRAGGDGDYYLGRDAMAEAVIDILDERAALTTPPTETRIAELEAVIVKARSKVITLGQNCVVSALHPDRFPLADLMDLLSAALPIENGENNAN